MGALSRDRNNSDGSLYAAAGMFTTVPASGTFTGVADDNEYDNDTIVLKASIAGNYTIATNGYGSLTIAAGDLEIVSVLGIYMTDPLLNLSDPNNTSSGSGGALLADLDGENPATGLNGTGVVIPQTDTSRASFAGSYAFGAQAFNVARGDDLGDEFDFVGQGFVSGNALSDARDCSAIPSSFSMRPYQTGPMRRSSQEPQFLIRTTPGATPLILSA